VQGDEDHRSEHIKNTFVQPLIDLEESFKVCPKFVLLYRVNDTVMLCQVYEYLFIYSYRPRGAFQGMSKIYVVVSC